MTVEKTMHEIAKFKFILEEGRKGNHLLFKSEAIRVTFTKGQEELFRLFREKLDEINTALNRSLSFESFEEKRDYISTLPEEIQQAMIFGYFQLLEENPEEPVERTLH
ncbi:MAG: hypothetical protein V1495_03930 [Pseudomonadota bacterium]